VFPPSLNSAKHNQKRTDRHRQHSDDLRESRKEGNEWHAEKDTDQSNEHLELNLLRCQLRLHLLLAAFAGTNTIDQDFGHWDREWPTTLLAWQLLAMIGWLNIDGVFAVGASVFRHLLHLVVVLSPSLLKPESITI
jgi:hypothetical protein